jgi:hypothetical protein
MGDVPGMVEFGCQMQRSRLSLVASELISRNAFVMHVWPGLLQIVSIGLFLRSQQRAALCA